MKYLLTLFTLAGALAAQIDPTPSPSPSNLTLTPAADLVSRLKREMTQEQVDEVIGRRADRYLGGDESHQVRDGGDLAEVWETSKDSLVVILKNHKVKSVSVADPRVAELHAVKEKSDYPAFQRDDSRPSNTIPAIVNTATGVYLTAVCPRVYRKPILWMTAADMQLVQVCNNNGFMLFGVYFYRGTAE